MTTIGTINATQLETLLQEAAQAGDEAQVALCRRALAGDVDAARACVATIREAEARS